MSTTKKTAVVICPGRGTYNKAELGYLRKHFPDQQLLNKFDAQRSARDQETLSALDGADRFSLAKHSRGDNASGLIFAATLGDFMSIDRAAIDVIAVTGNSMGWYSALACAGATSPEDGFKVANTMGTLMQEALIGGQLVYPFLGDDWVPTLAKRDELLSIAEEIDARADHTLSPSIHLGGMLVLAGNEAGLKAFESTVEPIDGRFPMRLGNHAAFHTPLQQPVAEKGRDLLTANLFGQPDIPMVDGRGAIWWPHASDTQALWDYTLGYQVIETYDFTRAIEVSAREFAPDLFIITGPGTTLGGAVAQSLILADWKGMDSKDVFKAQQAENALLVSMGMDKQRCSVT
ncbi:ACP S-malonyltransferase [Pontixanthobacter aestiaquae]|uniref:[acyl-carrier-protein] S-malonyltransferase n=1 Tax=Pontixanthobacter aestiaquae TaxID=1509367 RepID=A0A844Z4V3_9SPHN|nr:ACP S-malonyltransferase [Pontixanthobacter aestiaquae]MDN3646250.1 ACP S-malonyltransferase [Pontixanthobacter aestiaquae]MXO82758.1 ACP S-malonyltransferase [Pontixanthobacter aestiaquae]